MITELKYKCRRKGHGHLNCMEVDGLYYTYCPKCCSKHINFRGYYDFMGLRKISSLKRYLETDIYILKGDKKCYHL